MGAYILRRLLLIIPTMIGIMAISFLVVQFAPGGPIERIIAQIQGTDVSATGRFTGGGGDFQGVGGEDLGELEVVLAEGDRPEPRGRGRLSRARDAKRSCRCALRREPMGHADPR